MLEICYLDGEDLNAMMVREGHAMAYRRYSKRYASDENQARQDRQGTWATEFIEPWKWRRSNR